MEFSLGYITATDKAEAEGIVSKLLEKKLIACGTILPGAESYYFWNAELRHEKEVVILLKNKREHENAIIETVKKNHSYECPCVIFMPLGNGNSDFLEWIGKS